jgi:hypothetical protein
MVAGIVAVLAFSAGAVLGKGGSRRALNLPGRVAGTLGIDPATREPPADPRAEARAVLDLVARDGGPRVGPGVLPRPRAVRGLQRGLPRFEVNAVAVTR